MSGQTTQSISGSDTARTVAILAGISLALNLLAAGAYLGSTYFAARHGRHDFVDRRFDQLAGKLGVDVGSDLGLRDLRRAFKAAMGVRRARSQPLFEEILEEFAKPAPDTERIRVLQDQLVGVRRATGDEVLAGLVSFLKQATPEERTAMIALLRDTKDPATMPLRYGLVP